MEEQNLKLNALKQDNYEMYKYFKIGLEIITTLKEKMYEAYIVGGAVRDFLLCKPFNDIDISTNATPTAVKEIFKKYKLDTHYEHLGCIVLKISGFRYEITTFRNEEYHKHKIKNVHYSKKLIDDLQRRDYTINALALSPNLTVIDLHEGQKDLEKGVVKIIGKGRRRFKDDPSRILRGVDLVAKYNFSVDSKTLSAMKRGKKLITELSEQKLILLMKKILLEEHSVKGLKLISSIDLFKNLPIFKTWVKSLIKYKKLSFIEQMTLLYRIMGRIPEHHPHAKEEIVEIKRLYELSQYLYSNAVQPVFILKYGVNTLLSVDCILRAYDKKYKTQARSIKKLYKNLPIRSSRELNISPDEIKTLLNGDESQIGKISNQLLILVSNNSVKNDYYSLEKAALLLINGSDSEKQSFLEMELKETTEVSEEHQVGYNPSTYQNVLIEEGTKPDLDEVVAEFEKENFLTYEDINMPNDAEYNNSNNIENEFLTPEYTEEDNYVLSKEDQNYVRMFNDDVKELFTIYAKSVFENIEIELTEEEVARKNIEIENEVKSILIDRNPIYKDLKDRGII